MSGATVDRDLDSLWAELRRMQDKQAIVELRDRFAATMDAADYDGLSAVSQRTPSWSTLHRSE